jgi:hypothetical protein
LIVEIERLRRKAERKGVRLAVRLNGTSDLAWERIAPQLFTIFPTVQFYDYTKGIERMLRFVNARSCGPVGAWPANYDLTFSRSEDNESDCRRVLDAGGRVAVVFDVIPPTYYQLPVVDGDASDLRFLDPSLPIGLVAKGRAKRDRSGFVVRGG